MDAKDMHSSQRPAGMSCASLPQHNQPDRVIGNERGVRRALTLSGHEAPARLRRITADSTGNCLAVWSPITSSFSRPLVSTCRASPQIDEAAHAQLVGDRLQALAGRAGCVPSFF
jgi:hypothetical protein